MQWQVTSLTLWPPPLTNLTGDNSELKNHNLGAGYRGIEKSVICIQNDLNIEGAGNGWEGTRSGYEVPSFIICDNTHSAYEVVASLIIQGKVKVHGFHCFM